MRRPSTSEGVGQRLDLGSLPPSRRAGINLPGARAPVPVILDDDDIEAIADRVADKLRPPATALVGVREVARKLGVSPAWVYRNAELLGARRLGGGSKPPLRFDLEVALDRAQGARVGDVAAAPGRRGRPPRGPLPPGVEMIAPRHGRRP